MNIKLITPKKIIIFLIFIFALGTVVEFNIFAADFGDSCSYGFQCDYNIYPSGTEIIEESADCVSGTCSKTGSRTLHNCSKEDNSYCSNSTTKVEEIYHAETTGGTVCCVIDETKSTDCSTKNDTHCADDGDQIIKDIWACDDGSCVHHEEDGEVCSDSDYKYCSGDDVIQRSYECDEGSCIYDDTTAEECNDRDGDYCETDDILEERDYTCRNNGDDADCNDYDVDSSTDCTADGKDRSFCATHGTYGNYST
ncbi:MAG: hypothetical protein ACOCRX_05525, partial [Candidatus Woesearchaeota archaeon]